MIFLAEATFDYQWIIGIVIGVIIAPIIQSIFKRIGAVEKQTEKNTTEIKIVENTVKLHKEFMENEIKKFFETAQRIERKIDEIT